MPGNGKKIAKNMNNTPSGAKKHRESTEPQNRQTAKMFFFLSSSSQGDSNRSLKNYGFLYDAIFSSHVHVHKSLSNEM